MTLHRFYRILSSEGNETYIGSTTQSLSARWSLHKYQHSRNRNTSSSIILSKYGLDTCSIVLIHELDFENKADAMREERRLIEENREHAVNLIRPIREINEHCEEMKQYNRKHYEENRSKIIERCRNYVKENSDKTRDYQRNHYKENSEEKKAYRRKRYEENKDAINSKRSEKVPCDICGKHVARGNMAVHKKTKSCDNSD